MVHFKNQVKKEMEEYRLLLHNVPSLILVLFCLSVVLMNLLANKEIDTGELTWLALDCGYSLSWLSFLSMDMITKRFGAKASIEISITALLLNLVTCGVFALVALIPGRWSESYTLGEVANVALNNTIGGTWYVLMGSSIAFVVSAIVNSVVNVMLGNILKKKDTFKVYAIRSYVSTMIGQFVDNMIFSTVVCHVFFGWTWVQVVTCSITGCLIELICEIVFSPLGYKVCRRWETEGVGEAYLTMYSEGEQP